MDNELFELCKKVWEVTQWEDSSLLQAWILRGHSGYILGNRTREYEEGEAYSLYTSDYLLEKLLANFPAGIYETRLTTGVMDSELGMQWRAETKGDAGFYKVHESDTPLKALLKLTLALAEAGEL